MKLKGAEIVCESLIKEGVDTIFGMPGGSVIRLYDVLGNYPALRHILVRHEQGAAHAADGYARATGKVGVCFATSGPGATNLVTGIANAHMDSVPMVAITGQVARPFIGKDAFQEADITGITLPITKHNYLVMKAEDLAETIAEAFHIARTGRPGPVLIDIPRDVFDEETNFVYPDKVELPGFKPTLHGHPTQLKKAVEVINEAKRPVIIAGRGIIVSGASAELRELAEKTQMPVVNTLLGLSSFPHGHILHLGMLGMHGTAYANLAVSHADVIVAVGMRFDDRATGRVSGFAPQARVVHIDIDPAEIGKNVVATVPIVGDVKNVLQALNPMLQSATHQEWLRQIADWQRQYPLDSDPGGDHLMPQYVISQIWEATRGEALIVTGVGQHQMWTALHYRFSKPNSIFSSGGLGTMGFELPAAIGVKAGRPEETVWAICGDGSIQMTIQELATMAQEKLAVKMAVLNNGFLGMVRQWQELFYGKRYMATPLSGPDFVAIAGAYGIQGRRVTHRTEVVSAIAQAMDHPGPFLIDFQVEPEECVFPMVPPGATLAEFIKEPKREAVGRGWPRRSTP